MNRREFLNRSLIAGLGASMLSSASLSGLSLKAVPSKTPFNGIFPIMQTPFTEDDEIDVDVLLKEVNFIAEAGGHGMVWPQLAGEFYVLTDEERMRIPELMVKEARGRVPVIIGVQSNFWKTSIKFAKQAEKAGADGIISLPPYMGGSSLDAAIEYYKKLAHSVSLPIFIQNSGGSWGASIPVPAVIALAKECPTVCYIKEEVSPVTQRIGELVEKGKGLLKGVFSGASGKTMLNELRRGGVGSMPGAGFVDVYQKIYDSFVAGDKQKAQEIFDKLMAMQTFASNLWLGLEKEILCRRGIFKNTRLRVAPYKLVWDKVDQEEFEVLYADLKPYFKI
jgi:dihydrodipicolinate synthase/N-acetylneuraminate lyase